MEEFLTPRDVGYGHGLVQASIVFPGTRADVDKDAIIEAMGVEGYFFATMVYLVDDPNHNFGLLPEGVRQMVLVLLPLPAALAEAALP